jgi:GrpB-like predicted nucleotidyltransferase (UPF0157 family)
MVDAPVHIVAYDPSWPGRFEEEKRALNRALAPWIDGTIEHVGSTAVVGLCAKPVIDIMVGVRSLADSIPAKEVICGLGYQYADYGADVMHWFCKPSAEVRTHHLSLVPVGSAMWKEKLAFRDLLRADRRAAEEYGALKMRLAKEYEFDREGYTQAKGPFISGILSSVSVTKKSK